jgi:hypothetical protein
MDSRTKSCGIHCNHYASCSRRTRVFVNYCGSDNNRFEKKIREAFADCVSNRVRAELNHSVLSSLPMKRFSFKQRSVQETFSRETVPA